MGAKFLCCLPLRLGVAIFTIGQFLVAGAFAGLIWFARFAPPTNIEWVALSEVSSTPLIVVASVYSFVSLVGLLGFFGAVFKKTALVSVYIIVLWFSFFAQLAASIWATIAFFRFRKLGSLDDCDTKLGELKFDNLKLDLDVICDGLESLQKVHPAVVISIVVALSLVMSYVLYVSHSFLGRLKDKKTNKVYGGGSAIPTYAPVKQAENAPLTVQGAYPYSDSAHSFGASKTGYAPVGGSKV